MAKLYPCMLLSKVSPEQRDQVHADAATYGKSVCAYIRDRMTGKRIKSKSDMMMLAELRRVGAMIKHYRMDVPETLIALEKIHQAIERE
jgi:hypothetical protein